MTVTYSPKSQTVTLKEDDGTPVWNMTLEEATDLQKMLCKLLDDAGVEPEINERA